jgi:hypothetical protein
MNIPHKHTGDDWYACEGRHPGEELFGALRREQRETRESSRDDRNMKSIDWQEPSTNVRALAEAERQY